MSLKPGAGWLAVAVACVGMPALGAAIIIPVTNGSFEKPDVLNLTSGSPSDQNAAGGAQLAALYTTESANTGIHYYGPNSVNDPIPYWSVSTTNNSGMAYGVMDQVSSAFVGTSGGAGGGFAGLSANTDYTYNYLATLNAGYGYGYADGYQNAYANLAQNATLTMIYNPTDSNTGDPANTGQSLGTFVPGDTYSLTVGVGTPLTGGTYNYSIIILDNGTPVAATSGSAPATDTGAWIQASVPYTAVDSGAIGIELYATNPNAATGTVNFDDVALTDLGSSNAPPIPEPASLGVFGVGLLALRRNRR